MVEKSGKKKIYFLLSNGTYSQKGGLQGEKVSSDWNPGKGKPYKGKRRSKKNRHEATTIVVTCGGSGCVSDFQDKVYGKNKRVCNAAESKGNKKGRHVCSVCLKEHYS